MSKLYLMIDNYRSPNKSTSSKDPDPKFKTFTKGTYVEAEIYSTTIKNSVPSIINSNKYIIPMNFVRELSDIEAANVMAALDRSNQSSKINDNYLQPSVENNPAVIEARKEEINATSEEKKDEEKPKSEAEPIKDKLEKIKILKNNYVVGGAIGGLAGFFIGRAVGKGNILTVAFTMIGLAAGAYGFNKYKTKKEADHAATV